MTDAELRHGLESCALPAGSFNHESHVRLGFVYLRDEGLLGTLERYPVALRSFATHHGAPKKYHETVTWGLIFLIHERMVAAPELGDWSSFSEANSDLLAWPDSPLFERYPRRVLESDLARRTFILPHADPDGVEVASVGGG